MMSSSYQRAQSQDGWHEERCLGAGGFGTVTLWENKISKELLALKKCRLDLSLQNKARWQQEVEILKRLDHPNIVKAKDVPAVLDVRENDLPLLAMEYCQGGDLRKILNSPENICGLKESTVIKITANIASAVQFLHSMRIIHRDLKPENIVISYDNDQVAYKLIDLGYAKQLDQHSMATTFVGTLKYLAPELLAGNGSYTKTVDYWSLGTVLFECITGIRPFPDLSPVQWHMEIRQKSSNDIHAFFDTSDELKFSDELPNPNSLSQCFRAKFIHFLRLLLLWDAKNRGGVVLDSGKHELFNVLENLLNTKVVHIFCVFTCTLLTIEVNPNDKLEDLSGHIYKVTGVAVNDQEIITSSGEQVYTNSLMSEYRTSDSNPQSLLYLFSKSEVPRSPRPLFTLPQTMQCLVTESKTLLSYMEQKRVHDEALNFCYHQIESYQRLLQAHRTILKCTLKLNSKLSELRMALLADYTRLEERIEFCKESLDTDVEHYSDVAVELPGNDDMLRSWKVTERKYFDLNKAFVEKIDADAIEIQKQILEIQKLQFNQSQATNPMEEIYEAALNVYKELKQANLSFYDQKMADCSKIAEVVLKCLTKRERLTKDILTHLRHILNCTRQIQEMIPIVEETRERIAYRKGQISRVQKQRQSDVWSLLKRKDIPTAIAARSWSSDFNFCGSEDSSDLMQQSHHSIARLSEIFQSVKHEQDDVTPQKLDWSFLDTERELNTEETQPLPEESHPKAEYH